MIHLIFRRKKKEENDAYVLRLFLKNERSMYVIAMNIVNEHNAASDVVSEAFLKMLEKVDYLRAVEGEKQTPYILAIVKNTAMSYMRKRRNECFWTIPDEQIPDTSGESLDDALIYEAEMQELQTAISRLKVRDRDLLEMKYFSQMDDAQIGEQLGISKNSVRPYLSRVRKALKEELKKIEEQYD